MQLFDNKTNNVRLFRSIDSITIRHYSTRVSFDLFIAIVFCLCLYPIFKIIALLLIVL